MLHLLMAGCWLILGCFLLTWQWLDQAAPSATIWGTSIPLGWFAVAIALYNLLRWWLGYSSRKASRQDLEPTLPRGRRVADSDHSPPAVTPDPNFDFTTDPPHA